MTTRIVFSPATPQNVQEGSYYTNTVTFYDADGTAAAPTTVHYRVDDEGGDAVVEATSVTAATSVAITVAASLNVMLDEDHRRERRILTVEANRGTSTAVNGSTSFDIVNTLGF